MFEAIEEEDRVVENEDGGNPALLGSCNDRAKQLHASPSGLHFKCAAVTLVVSKFSVIHKLQLISDAPMRMQPFFFPYHAHASRNMYYSFSIFHKDKGLHDNLSPLEVVTFFTYYIFS